MAAIMDRTAFNPTPRPEVWVMVRAVLNPE
jgi:hypothetical protein